MNKLSRRLEMTVAKYRNLLKRKYGFNLTSSHLETLLGADPATKVVNEVVLSSGYLQTILKMLLSKPEGFDFEKFFNEDVGSVLAERLQLYHDKKGSLPEEERNFNKFKTNHHALVNNGLNQANHRPKLSTEFLGQE